MRKILTVNNQVEFHEISSDGVILNIKAFQYGVLHYQIKNGKVVFYSNADENPWRNEVWSVDMPVTIDDEVYSTADEVAEALSAVMNDSYQEQLDALQEGLATEEGRAQAAEEALQTAIENETSRAVSAETQLQGEITEMSGTVATFDNRITNVENGLSALTETVNDEITRSTAKDAEHDALISGLTTSLQNEVTRAQGAESALTNSLNNEIARATSAETVLHNEILAERDRALAAENAIDDKIDAEVSRSTAKDASQDALISGLTTSLQNEINRAQGAENSLRSDLNAEISARTTADAAQLQRITALEVGKADANSVYTKQESDAKYTTKDYISGLTEAFFDAAVYDSQTKKINFYHGNTIKAQIDATDFIKDGMVDNVAISGSNLVITFNTDAGKEPISIPLTDIFDPSIYYTKSEIDNALGAKQDVITEGRAIDITNNVISLDLPISAGTGTNSIIEGNAANVASGEYSHAEGNQTTANGVDSHAEGTLTIASGDSSHAEGDSTKASGNYSHAEGYATSATSTNSHSEGGHSLASGTYSHAEGRDTIASGDFASHAEGRSTIASGATSHAEGGSTIAYGKYSHVEGSDTIANNDYEHASGIYNVSNKVNTTFGDSGNTLFSVGNGTISERHNAFEIRQNGDIYITSGNTTIKLQDNLGAEGGTFDPTQYYTKSDTDTLLDAKASKSESIKGYSFGETNDKAFVKFQKADNSYLSNIYYSKINGKGIWGINNVNAVKNFELIETSAITTSITSSSTDSQVPSAKAVYDALGTEGITSAQCQTLIDNSISGKTNQSDFSAHTANTTVHVTASEKSTWNAKSDFSGNYNDLTNKLSAGTNVSITNNVISATDTTYSAGDGISISNQNVISTVTKFWCGDEAAYNQIAIKDPNTIYLIHS